MDLYQTENSSSKTAAKAVNKPPTIYDFNSVSWYTVIPSSKMSFHQGQVMVKIRTTKFILVGTRLFNNDLVYLNPRLNSA